MNTKPPQEQIINQAFKCHSQGNILEAAKNYQYFIKQSYKDHRVFSNYGIILRDLGKLQEAEISLRKAIEIKPDYAEAHSNLGTVLKDLGNFSDAINHFKQAIKLNDKLSIAKAGLIETNGNICDWSYQDIQNIWLPISLGSM